MQSNFLVVAMGTITYMDTFNNCHSDWFDMFDSVLVKEVKMKFNINNNVKVQLTETGKKILRENFDKLYTDYGRNPPKFKLPKEDKNGWSIWQLWVLINEFGNHMHMGFDLPFKTVIDISEKE